MKQSQVKKTTFDLDPEVARRLAELKHELQYDEGFAASEASGVNIVSALILSASAKQVARLLKKSL
jgi:predicted transcriptional regulator